MMTPEKVEIKEECYSLDYGDVMRIVCPFCRGGSSSERSMLLDRELTGVLYKCFRDKCKARGFVPTGPAEVHEGERPSKQSKVKPFRKQTRNLTNQERELLCNKFSLLDEDIDKGEWSFSTEDNRVIQPIFNVRGGVIGHNSRAYPEFFGDNINKKSIAYYEDTEYPKACFFGGDRVGGKIVLVEDIVSALKVESVTGTPSVALLGTNVTRGLENHLLAHKFNRLIICLDPDAQQTAISTAKRLSLNFAAEVLPLPDDPKDIDRSTLHSYILGD